MDEKENPTEVTVDDAVDTAAVDVLSKEELTPSAGPEMLTQEQAEKLADGRHSKLDKRISELEKAQGKSTKALVAATKRAVDAEQMLAQARKQQQELERKALGDSPDALSLFEAKIAHKQALDDFEARVRKNEEEKAEWEDAVNEAKLYKVKKQADELASKYEVDSELLISMTDGSQEKMEKLAKVLPKKTEEDKVKIPRPPDSGRRSKVLSHPTVEQLNSMSMEQYAEYVADRDKNRR